MQRVYGKCSDWSTGVTNQQLFNRAFNIYYETFIVSIEGVIRDSIQALYITRIFRVFVLILLHDSTTIWSIFVHAHTLIAHMIIFFMHILLLFVK